MTYCQKGSIVVDADRAAGRLALRDRDITLPVMIDVRVSCYKCGGVTVFPVLIRGGIRPTPAPCYHCGVEI